MIETLRFQRETLNKMYVTTRDIDQDGLPAGMRLTLGIYLQILADGLSVLNSMIGYLESTERYTDKNAER